MLSVCAIEGNRGHKLRFPCSLLFGVLYPAYASYKAVKNKDVRSHLQWMMYWIVFALFTCIETFSDIFISFWMPFYYELKILFVLWLLSPATKGSSLLYRRFVHPQLVQREQEIDELIEKAKEQGYSTMLLLGSRGLSYATSVVLQTAIKAQEIIATHRSSGLAAIQMGDDSYNQLDGSAIGWMSVEGSREIVPPVLTPDLLPSPLGTGEAMDLDHNAMTESKRAASTQGEPSNPRTPQTATKRSIRNRARQGKAAEQTGSLRRSSRQAKNQANKD
ncbi:receptor expression enhancing protein A isoform X1 [Haemaphysalis longicornis]